MKQDVEELTCKAAARTKKIITAVVSKKRNRVGNGLKKIEKINAENISTFHAMTKDYTVNDDCVSCGL
jgi:hypothetical protein